MNATSAIDWPALAHGTAIAASTLVQEDAPTLAAALLAHAGRLHPVVAFVSCFLGIWVGDALLYATARIFGRPLLEKPLFTRFVPASAYARAERWFGERGTSVLILSRLIPGMRLPTYLAAGLLRTSLPKFLLVTGAAVLAWVAALFGAARVFAPQVAAGTGITRSLYGILAVAAIAAVAIRLLIALARRLRCDGLPASLRRMAHWEFWPAGLFYLPVGMKYLWLSIRHGGLTVPTSANPGMFSGGIIGESKIATLNELSAVSPTHTAEAHLVLPGAFDQRLRLLRTLTEEHHFSMPFILKPDVGQRGAGVRVVRSWPDAAAYLGAVTGNVIVQRYAAGPHEAGIFYYRRPGEARGRIFAITEKIFPAVVGDGSRSIRELILADARARLVAQTYLRRFEDRANEVLAAGVQLRLVEAGNHAQGCIFRDGMHLWSGQLEAVIDRISQGLTEFYVGRYDVRYRSEADLRDGRFQIVELNGAAAEATSIYDARNSLAAAYRTLFRQWQLVFEIGAANRRRGHSPMELRSLWKTWRRYVADSAAYPAAD